LWVVSPIGSGFHHHLLTWLLSVNGGFKHPLLLTSILRPSYLLLVFK
jgi:hypothetical protein